MSLTFCIIKKYYKTISQDNTKTESFLNKCNEHTSALLGPSVKKLKYIVIIVQVTNPGSGEPPERCTARHGQAHGLACFC